MIGIETRIKIAQVNKAVDQKSGANEQQKRHRHFANNKEIAEAIAPAPGARVASAFLQIFVEIKTRGLRRRNQPKDQSCKQTNEHSKGEHFSVNCDPLRERNCRRDELPQDIKSDDRQ